MADETTTEETEGATSAGTETETQEDGQPAELGDAGKRALAAERDRAKAAEKRARELEAELEEFRRSQLSEHERAIEEARAAARAETQAELGSRIVTAEFRAAAAGRLADDQLSVLLDTVDLTKFLADSGEVDVDKVQAVIDGIAHRPETATDLGQGARSATPGLGSDPLLEALKSTVGAR